MIIQLTALDLGIAAILVLLLAIVNIALRTRVAKSLVISAARTVVQLFLIGHVLRLVFDTSEWYWVFAIMFVMLLIAGYEVTARQNRRFSGLWGYGLGAFSMFVSAFSVLLLAMLVIVQPEPWYQPRYAIPMLGMLLGNSMTGVALALDRLTDAAWKQRNEVEGKLMLGYSWNEAINSAMVDSMRSGLMPIINAMAAAGVVSLPGMMTGQILGGTPPVEAVKYQILIMFLIAAASGIGTLVAVHFGARRLFDERQRLRLDRLRKL